MNCNKDKKYLISICIPSYNRPETLGRLLRSVDTKYNDRIQIVICEDKAPKRLEVRSVVEEFEKDTPYDVKYVENENNLGHGKNFRQCIHQADGEYVTYMGDDDIFVAGRLDSFVEWLDKNRNIGYVLRAWASREQEFNYYKGVQYFEPGVKTYEEFFLKSVFMSGFTIKRDYCEELEVVEELDDTLLYQLYMMAEVVMKYHSAYYPFIFVKDIGDGISYFGSSESEKGKFEVGKFVGGSINLTYGYQKISRYLDKKHGIDSTSNILMQMSKFSYPAMSTARTLGIKEFKKHVKNLRAIGLDKSNYFNVYYYALLIFGKEPCDIIIRMLKRIIGKRPNL